MADRQNRALEQTRRLLEAQRGQAVPEERAHRGLSIEARGVAVLVPISDVVEIAVCENITPVPLTQPWIRGLTNVHGQLVTVVDLSVFLGGTETRLSRDARIVILGQRGLGTCLLVNNVSGLRAYSDDDIVARPDDLATDLAPFFKSGVRVENTTFAVLDIDALSSDERYRTPSRVAGETQTQASLSV